MLVFLFVLLFAGIANAQDKQKSAFGIHFSGFINSQIFYDTRQIIEAREGMVSLLPRNANYDKDGNDINAHPSLNQLAMTSRIRGNISGPMALGAKTSGVIEGDFTGPSNADNNGFRLREAYVKLKWKNNSLLVGLYWHPLYTPDVRPTTIGLNTGAPFHPFSRHNQIRFQQKVGIFKIIAVAASQRDYASDGPDGRTSKYLRNAVLPNLDLQLQITPGKHILGIGLDYKAIVPRLYVKAPDGSEYKTKEKVHSLATVFFAKIEIPLILLKLGSVVGENLTEHIMAGGYIEQLTDTVRHEIKYAPTSQVSAWMDISTKGKKIRYALFAGYSKNLGYNKTKQGKFYGNFNDLSFAYRIAPRVQIYSGKFMLAGELEYTVAAYGKPDSNGLISDSKSFNNLRILAGAFYFF